jgi:adenosylhomocysteine nucleosidase
VRLGVVTGLEQEARCLRAFAAAEQTAVCCRGAGPPAAASAAAKLLREGCSALLSYGFAGGLTTGLRPGDIVVAEAIVDADGRAWPTDPGWRAALLRKLAEHPRRRVEAGRLAGLDRPLLTPLEKAECGRRLSATAVDMESAAVAAAAADAGVPFLAVRVVIDPVDRAVPAWLVNAIDSRGKPRPGRLLAGLAVNPRDLLALLRLARDQRSALVALRDVAVDAGLLFALA